MATSKTLSNTLTAKDVILTSRPHWWIVTGAAFMVGYLTGGLHFSWPLAVGTFYFMFPYSLLVYGFNDIFDLFGMGGRKQGGGQ